MKKRLSLVVAIVTVLSTVLLAGCGCGSGTNPIGGKKVESTLDKEHVFKMEGLDVMDEFSEVRYQNVVGNKLMIFGNNYNDETNANEYKIVSYDLDTKESTSVVLVTGHELENTSADNEEVDEFSEFYENHYFWYNQGDFDEDGNFYTLVEIYDEINNVDGYVYGDSYYLIKFDPQGNKVWENVLFDQSADSEGYFYMSNMLVLADGTVLAKTEDGATVYDGETGEVKGKADCSTYSDVNFYKVKGNKVVAITWDMDYSKQTLVEFDVNTAKFGQTINVDCELSNFSFLSEGRVHDMILQGDNELYYYDFGSEPVEMMDFIDSDVYCYSFNCITMIDDEHFVGAFYDPTTWETNVSLFSKVAPSDVVEKKALVLAGVYVDSDITKQVIEFNKNSQEYRIQITDYNKYWSSDDFRAAYTKLNNDIVAGNMPDILLCDSSTPFESYATKGLLADIGKLIDEDPEINRDDYLSNVLDAVSLDGTLYCLVSQFSINTLTGAKKLVGDRSSWTMDEFISFAESLPEDCSLVNYMTQEEFLTQYTYLVTGQYIDYANSTCNFDDGNFANVLEISKKYFPKEIDYSDDDIWLNSETAYRDGRTALAYNYIGDFRSFATTEQGMFGTPVTNIGYPCTDGNGSIIQTNARFAISSMTPYTDGCWEFLKYYLSDDYQDNIGWQFPIKISSLEKLGETAMQRPYWENEDGSKEYYDDVYYVGQEEIILHPLTQAEVDNYIEYIKSVKNVASYNEEVINIILEESAPFFAGQKSAADCCSIIQSRVSLYLSESN